MICVLKYLSFNLVSMLVYICRGEAGLSGLKGAEGEKGEPGRVGDPGLPGRKGEMVSRKRFFLEIRNVVLYTSAVLRPPPPHPPQS